MPTYRSPSKQSGAARPYRRPSKLLEPMAFQNASTKPNTSPLVFNTPQELFAGHLDLVHEAMFPFQPNKPEHPYWRVARVLDGASRAYPRSQPIQGFKTFFESRFKEYVEDLDALFARLGVSRDTISGQAREDLEQIIGTRDKRKLITAMETYSLRSLDDDISPGHDSDSTFGDLQASPSVPPDEEALTIVRNEALYTAIAELPERERQILRSRFGLDGGEEKTLEQIGKENGVSRRRVGQIEAKALDRLRRNMTLIKETQ